MPCWSSSEVLNSCACSDLIKELGLVLSLIGYSYTLCLRLFKDRATHQSVLRLSVITNNDTILLNVFPLKQIFLCFWHSSEKKKCLKVCWGKTKAERHRHYYMLPCSLKALITCIYTKLKIVLPDASHIHECQEKNRSLVKHTNKCRNSLKSSCYE